MIKKLFICFFSLLSFSLLSLVSQASTEGQLGEGMVNPGFYEKPNWFKGSFLELQDDLNDANDKNRQIILYFHQDGCPYCKKLLDDNFSRPAIVETMSQNFDLIEINMWGDKAVTLFDGEEVSEKEFARRMKVMFTPTLIFLDHKGQSQFRMNGYYAPEKFSAALDRVLSQSGKVSQTETLQNETPAIVLMNKPKEKFISKAEDLSALIQNSKKPVMILFEQGDCLECNELHGDLFRRLPVYKQLKQFTIAQVDINSAEKVVAPGGELMSQKKLAKHLNIHYTPSILFYEPGESSEVGPVFRSEAYLKNFHIQAVFDYILTQAYLTEPEFQRFVQRRADKMREEGVEVELWD